MIRYYLTIPLIPGRVPFLGRLHSAATLISAGGVCHSVVLQRLFVGALKSVVVNGAAGGLARRRYNNKTHHFVTPAALPDNHRLLRCNLISILPLNKHLFSSIQTFDDHFDLISFEKQIPDNDCKLCIFFLFEYKRQIFRRGRMCQPCGKIPLRLNSRKAFSYDRSSTLHLTPHPLSSACGANAICFFFKQVNCRQISRRELCEMFCQHN